MWQGSSLGKDLVNGGCRSVFSDFCCKQYSFHFKRFYSMAKHQEINFCDVIKAMFSLPPRTPQYCLHKWLIWADITFSLFSVKATSFSSLSLLVSLSLVMRRGGVPRYYSCKIVSPRNREQEIRPSFLCNCSPFSTSTHLERSWKLEHSLEYDYSPVTQLP